MPWSDKPPICFMLWSDKSPISLKRFTNPCMLHAMVWQTSSFLGTCFMPWSDKLPSASCHGLTPPPNLLHAMVWQNGHVIYNSAFPSLRTRPAVVLVSLVGWLNGQCLDHLIWLLHVCFCFCTCGFVCLFLLLFFLVFVFVFCQWWGWGVEKVGGGVAR